MWGCHSPSVDEGLGVDVGAGERQDFAKSGQTGFECTARKIEEGHRQNAHGTLLPEQKYFVSQFNLASKRIQKESKRNSKGIQKEFKRSSFQMNSK